MSVERELTGMEEAVAMAQAAFDEAVALRHMPSIDRTLRPGVGLVHAQLGAARIVLSAMRLRLIARLQQPRLDTLPLPPRLPPPHR